MNDEATASKCLTAIIPLRLVPGVYQARERLERLMETIPADLYEVLIVDYGSKPDEAATIASIAGGREHVRIVHVAEAEEKIFSIGAARDIGVQHASAPVVIFNDIDFYAAPLEYRRIADEVVSRRLAERAYDFFCVPVVFLTEPGSDAYWAASRDAERTHLIHDAAMTLDKQLIEFVAYGSSAMVVNKHHYLSLGGHSPEFFGHGAEDFDVLHRMSSYYKRGPRPRDYYRDLKSNQITDYTGFRSYFALYGIDVFQRGLFMVHLWHPKRTMKNYMQSSRNFSILNRLMREFDKKRKQPPALADASADRRTLMLAEPTSRAYRSLRHAVPLMGELVVRPETVFKDAASLREFVADERIDTVGFLNPYGNEHRLSLYRGVREAKIPYWTFDRGALPQSWFFDPQGFNFDSETYARAKWDHPIDDSQRAAVTDVLKGLQQSSSTLEENGPRFSVRHWKDTLGIGDRKVLFVPLQRPRDTVVRYFSGAAVDYSEFSSWVRYVAEQLDPRHWVVLAKRHPLEDEQPDLGGRVKYVPANAHIHDLMDLADRVMLLNSGTGVLAMAFGTPTVVCGQAFYRHDGLNVQASSQEEALAHVVADLSVDPDAVARFYHHLTQVVYSFGPAKYAERRDESNKRIRLAEDIMFTSIRGLSESPKVLGRPSSGVSLDAPLFFSYGGRSEMLRNPDEAPSKGRRRKLVAGALTPVMPQRLRRKLNEDPEQFFADSKNPVVRQLGKILL